MRSDQSSSRMLFLEPKNQNCCLVSLLEEGKAWQGSEYKKCWNNLYMRSRDVSCYVTNLQDYLRKRKQAKSLKQDVAEMIKY